MDPAIKDFDQGHNVPCRCIWSPLPCASESVLGRGSSVLMGVMGTLELSHVIAVQEYLMV